MEIEKKKLVLGGISLALVTALVTSLAVIGGTSLVNRFENSSNVNEKDSENNVAKGSGTSPDQQRIQKIAEEVVPEKGSDTGYGIDYSTSSIRDMIGWYRDTELSESEKERYIRLGQTNGTSCEYCCGAKKAVATDGRSNCGCSHNFAIAGLLKHLVSETEMDDKQILSEVDDWKAYFFPRDVVKEELEKRGGTQDSGSLPQMRGGC